MSLGPVKSRKLEGEDCSSAAAIGSFNEVPILTCRGGGIPGNEKPLYWEVTANFTGLHGLFLPAEQGFGLGLPDAKMKMKMQRWLDCRQDTVMDTGVKDMVLDTMRAMDNSVPERSLLKQHHADRGSSSNGQVTAEMQWECPCYTFQRPTCSQDWVLVSYLSLIELPRQDDIKNLLSEEGRMIIGSGDLTCYSALCRCC
jgi:hypothetical protein